jgi:hypothetical protein
VVSNPKGQRRRVTGGTEGSRLGSSWRRYTGGGVTGVWVNVEWGLYDLIRTNHTIRVVASHKRVATL